MPELYKKTVRGLKPKDEALAGSDSRRRIRKGTPIRDIASGGSGKAPRQKTLGDDKKNPRRRRKTFLPKAEIRFD